MYMVFAISSAHISVRECYRYHYKRSFFLNNQSLISGRVRQKQLCISCQLKQQQMPPVDLISCGWLRCVHCFQLTWSEVQYGLKYESEVLESIMLKD